MNFDVVVIGAGAAGMMCAAVAGQRGRSVLLIDHSNKLGEKIRISGGGRCNFTNLNTRPEAFLSRNPYFSRAALARYTPADFVALVERHGITYHEKTLGQLFCDESAVQIIDMLRTECDAGGVQWAMPSIVEQIARTVDTTAHGARFELNTSRGLVHAQSVVIATGGLSIPKIGATPFGYRIAEQFGLAVIAPQPALVPLAASPEWLAQFSSLSGTSFETIVSITSAKRARHPEFRESALVTHRGLSGPAILQISSYWQMSGGGAITIDLLPDLSSQQIRAELNAHRAGQQSLGTWLAEYLPKRFAR
ncbi:MAG TPA: aminoacetone oxidase family FAD-binding enzyme, partial [Burkholderiales bacterium]|nr:aminoacetone oxidase family FAD-binding enzyme [Burkholderiales bacterium]